MGNKCEVPNTDMDADETVNEEIKLRKPNKSAPLARRNMEPFNQPDRDMGLIPKINP